MFMTLVAFYRYTMEEPSADIEVTVKTLDSQSRTYTVGGQVNEDITPYWIFRLRMA